MPNLTPLEMLARLKIETEKPYWDEDYQNITELFETLRTAIEEYEGERSVVGKKPDVFFVDLGEEE